MLDKNAEEGLKLSVVVPVYNSEQCLGALVEKISEALHEKGISYEVVLVNDGSNDHSWGKISELSKRFEQINGINLRKNFGQDNAIMAGLINSQGEIIVIMDDDLQHDPCDLIPLMRKVEEGYDVCYASFAIKKQSWFKNYGSWFNGKVAEIVLKKPREIYLSPYKAINRKIVDEINKYDGPYPYIDGLIFNFTQNITQIMAQHHQRFAGKGNFNLIKSLSIWSRLAISFSIAPLRIATFIGFIIASVSFMLALLFIIQYVLGEPAPSGWASMIVVVLFLGGIQLLILGVMGEYIGRLALYNNKKPQFSIDKIISGDNNERLL